MGVSDNPASPAVKGNDVHVLRQDCHVVLTKQRTAAPTSESSMHEEEGDALPCDFIVHVKTIDTFRWHMPLVPSYCSTVVVPHSETMDDSIDQDVMWVARQA